MRTSGLPLSGIRVLDLGQIFAGGYCGFLLAMAGAEVVKVEPPRGDRLRHRIGLRGGSGALQFEMLNANKAGMTINLKSDEGVALLFNLVKEADVLLENFAPGALAKLGVTWQKLHEANSRLVYAAGTGYGIEGPYQGYPAMDLTVQAMAGIMSVTGYPDRPPVKAGPAVCDFLGGTHLYGAIVTALVQRATTGEGSYVDVSLLDSVYPSLASSLGLLYSGKGTNRTGNRHAGLGQSPYNVYPTNDGYVAIICVAERQWRNLAEVMGRPELKTDPRFATMFARVENMDDVDREVSAWTSTVDKATAFQRLIERDVPSAPVRTLDEVVTDGQMHARGMLVEVEHDEYGTMTLPNSPIRFNGVPRAERRPSPSLGQHNAEVLGDWLGLDETEVEALKKCDAI